MSRPKKTEEGEWKLSSSKTFAKGTKSWLDEDGALHFKHTVATGSPEEVKKIFGSMKNGEKSEMETSHNVEVYEREVLSPNTHGTIKEKEFKVIQKDDIGDGEAPTATGVNDEVPQDLSPLGVLKNFVDNLAQEVRQHKNWLIGLGIGLGAVAVGLIGLGIYTLY